MLLDLQQKYLVYQSCLIFKPMIFYIRYAACIVGKIVKSRMKSAGHMVRMKDDTFPKRSETKKQDVCIKRGRPQLRWEDCMKIDLRKAEEEEKWREKANNSDQRKRITKVPVHPSDQ